MSQGNEFGQGLGFAYRIVTELVVATLVGAVMGYALDWFFDTKPWFLALGVIFGGGAGCLAVYRVAMANLQTGETNPDDENQQDTEKKD